MTNPEANPGGLTLAAVRQELAELLALIHHNRRTTR